MSIKNEWIGMNAICPGCRHNFTIRDPETSPTPQNTDAPVPAPVNQFGNGAPGYGAAPMQPASAINAGNWFVSYEESCQINKLFTIMWICYAASILTCGISWLAGWVLMFIMLYKFWTFIPYYENPDTAPGKAVGFCFIPFFNFYWIFIAFRKLAVYYQRYTSAPIVIYALAFCILYCCSYIPNVGALMFIGALMFQILLFNELRKITNALGAKNAGTMPQNSAFYGNSQFRNY